MGRRGTIHLFSILATVTKLLYKVSFLIVLITALQYAYYHGLGNYIPAIKKTSRMDNLFKNDIQDPFDIAMLASSINFTTAKTDRDKRDIAQMVEDDLGCGVLDVSRGGNNIELYDEITDKILGSVSYKPKFVYEISVRTFSRVFSEPANSRSLKDDEVIFKDNILSSFYHALNVFRYDFGLMTQKEFDHMDVYKGTEYLTTLDQFMRADYMPELSEPHKKYLINYMSRINKNSEKVEALKKLAKHVQNNNLDVLFLIPPENVRQGIKYFPNSFKAEFEANTSMLKSILDEYNCSYIDLSQKLNAKYFTHAPNYPNGHLTEDGRLFVSQQIAAHIDCMVTN